MPKVNDFTTICGNKTHDNLIYYHVSVAIRICRCFKHIFSVIRHFDGDNQLTPAIQNLTIHRGFIMALW